MRGKRMEKECKFCHTYEILKDFEKRIADEEYKKQYKTKYFASLITRDWDKVNKQYVGRIGHETVALKYCPLCGKKLKR